MNFREACQSAREGNFVSHKSFDDSQSMHAYKWKLYYEDGPNLSVNGGIQFIEKQDWAKDGWYIKHTKDKVDQTKLETLHNHYNGKMLPYGRSYEECII